MPNQVTGSATMDPGFRWDGATNVENVNDIDGANDVNNVCDF